MKRRSGFTLIELMVVVAIIALLMSILMPALHRANKMAQTVACQTRLKQWALCYKLYTDDNDAYFPTGVHGDPDGLGDGGIWMETLRPYYKDSWGMLCCPTAKVPAEGRNDYGTFKAESWEHGGHEFIVSYGENSWTNMTVVNIGSGGHRKKEWFWKGIHKVPKNANNIPLLGDASHFDCWPYHVDEPPLYADQNLSGDQGQRNEIRNFCINRHNGFINMLFVDFTVRKIGLKELWKLQWNRHWERQLEPPTEDLDPSPYIRTPDNEPDWPKWMVHFKDY